MTVEKLSLQVDYWEKFELHSKDVEYLYNYLLETEIPLTTDEVLSLVIEKRIQEEIARLKSQQHGSKKIYFPKDHYQVEQRLVFPAFQWQDGEVTTVRQGNNPTMGEFEVVKVRFASGVESEFASGIEDHVLNTPPEIIIDDEELKVENVLRSHYEVLIPAIEEELESNADFAQIAGKWFPRSLLIDINIGHLNIAEAMLDMAGGGTMSTGELMKHLDLDTSSNPKLTEFSLNWALQEDPRFDEVGPAGQTLWYLNRLEPESVLHTPLYLRHHSETYDRSLLSDDMLVLEQELDDELSPVSGAAAGSAHVGKEKCVLRLIYPHWRAGTLPLSNRIQSIFPTAYEAPRVRFWFVDGETKEKFPAWVVRQEKYVYGLEEWYKTRGLIPGSLVQLRRGQQPGEVIINTGNQRASRDYLRTVLVGTDGGIVFATLRQVVKAEYDERMAFFVANVEGLSQAWVQYPKGHSTLEGIITSMMYNMTKLTPQGHIHASELYAAVNLIYRCPPGPILAILTSQPQFVHVGDLYYHVGE